VELQHFSRRTLDRAVKRLADDDATTVKNLLHEHVSAGGTLAVTMDFGSTEGTMKQVLGFTVHWANGDGMHEAVLACSHAEGRHTSDRVDDMAHDIMTKYALPLPALIGFTHDGGSNMQDVFQELDSCMDVPCVAHMASNWAKKVLLHRDAKELYSLAHGFVTTIRLSPVRRELFLEAQVRERR